ncbi:MAG: hypothetical protein CVV07_12115 [Gammaproteobacteria bacterium HGW-Gammaproteobacteria-11]|nr:MAG: hypothetical protein CVV07_12115 [Gammaproteobacteria bacterium HGW-Gammaproteobacteria-11]
MIDDVQKPSEDEADSELEAGIAERASMATNMAYLRAKKLYCTVVVSKGGYVVEERPDGSEKILGVSTRRKVLAGVPISIRVRTV